MGIILSIKPEYAKAILSGDKKVEFRKKIFKKKVDQVFIYSSSPEKKIVGFFTINGIVVSTPEKLWKSFGKVGGITKENFFNYYSGLKQGYSICINRVAVFSKKINPEDIFPQFVAPQSYAYLDEKIKKVILEKAKIYKSKRTNKK